MAKSAQRLQRERQRAIRNQVIITDPSKCYVCRTTGLSEKEKFCPNCGFPQQGTNNERKRFIWVLNNKKQVLEDHRKKIKKATNVLFVLGGIYVVFGGIFVAASPREAWLALILYFTIVAAIYVALALWSRKNPFPAILGGFFVYVTLMVIDAINDPASLGQGVIWKFFIISALGYGYSSVKKARALEADLASTKKARELNIEPVNIEEANVA